jgi:hypothetical protein
MFSRFAAMCRRGPRVLGVSADLPDRDEGRPGRGALVSIAACLAAVAVACSGGGPAQPGGSSGPGGATGGGNAGGSSSGTPSSGAPATSPGPVPAGLVDPCALLSADAAGKIVDGTVLEGIRDPEEDGTYAQCTWRNDRAFLAGEIDFAPPLTVYLAPRSDGFAQQLQATIGSGTMDALSGTAAELAGISSADLGTIGVSGAAGLKGGIYFRIACWSPQVPAGGEKKASKAICSEAAKAVAGALP